MSQFSGCIPGCAAKRGSASVPSALWHDGTRGVSIAIQVRKIAEWLGAEPTTEFELAQVVRRGLPLTTQAVFLSHGLTKGEFHHIVIPLRTFRHRKERLNKGLEEMLTPDESDKAVRAARVLALAERVFANRETERVG